MHTVVAVDGIDVNELTVRGALSSGNILCVCAMQCVVIYCIKPMEHFAGDVSGTAVHLTTRSQNGAVKQHTVYRELRKEVEAKSLLLECCNTVAKSLEELHDPPSPGLFSLFSTVNQIVARVLQHRCQTSPKRSRTFSGLYKNKKLFFLKCFQDSPSPALCRIVLYRMFHL